MSAIAARTLLDRLAAHRRDAAVAGERVAPELDAEIEACRAAFVGLAVTEVACFRGELWGRGQG
jgi:hypothetical protein